GSQKSKVGTLRVPGGKWAGRSGWGWAPTGGGESRASKPRTGAKRLTKLIEELAYQAIESRRIFLVDKVARRRDQGQPGLGNERVEHLGERRRRDRVVLADQHEGTHRDRTGDVLQTLQPDLVARRTVDLLAELGVDGDTALDDCFVGRRRVDGGHTRPSQLRHRAGLDFSHPRGMAG